MKCSFEAISFAVANKSGEINPRGRPERSATRDFAVALALRPTRLDRHVNKCYTYLFKRKSMEKQNVTLSFSKALLKRAKRLALDEEKSFNELVRQCLEHRLDQATGYAKARKRQVHLLESGFDLGTNGRVGIAREEIHERR